MMVTDNPWSQGSNKTVNNDDGCYEWFYLNMIIVDNKDQITSHHWQLWLWMSDGTIIIED